MSSDDTYKPERTPIPLKLNGMSPNGSGNKKENALIDLLQNPT